MEFTYVILEIVPGKDHYVYAEVAKLPEARDPWLTVGMFDLIARVEVERFEQLTDVFSRIRAISGVADVKTLGRGLTSVGELPAPVPPISAAA